jgi:hypothetical protein
MSLIVLKSLKHIFYNRLLEAYKNAQSSRREVPLPLKKTVSGNHE